MRAGKYSKPEFDILTLLVRKSRATEHYNEELKSKMLLIYKTKMLFTLRSLLFEILPSQIDF
jgi:hypothetical protein